MEYLTSAFLGIALIIGVVSVALIKTRFFVFPPPTNLFKNFFCISSAFILANSILIGSVSANDLLFGEKSYILSSEGKFIGDYQVIIFETISVVYLASLFKARYDRVNLQIPTYLILMLFGLALPLIRAIPKIAVDFVSFNVGMIVDDIYSAVADSTQPIEDIWYIFTSSQPLSESFAMLTYTFFQSHGNMFAVANDVWPIMFFGAGIITFLAKKMFRIRIVNGAVSNEAEGSNADRLLTFVSLILSLAFYSHTASGDAFYSIDLANDEQKILLTLWLVSLLTFAVSIFRLMSKRYGAVR